MSSRMSLPPRPPTLADAEFDRISRHCVYFYGFKIARGVFWMRAEFDKITSRSYVFYFAFESCKGSCFQCEDTIDQIVGLQHPSLRGLSEMYQALHS